MPVCHITLISLQLPELDLEIWMSSFNPERVSPENMARRPHAHQAARLQQQFMPQLSVLQLMARHA